VGYDLDEVIQAAMGCLVNVSGEQPPPDQIVSFLVTNQVPLLSLAPNEERRYRHGGRLVESHAFVSALQGDARSFHEAHLHFRSVVQQWDGDGIPSICFKSAGVYPSFPYTSENIDVLVQPDDAEAAARGLVRLGYVELRNIEEPEKWMFRLFAGGRSLSAIHLHTRVGWGQGFMLESEIWRRRRVSPDDAITWVPGPEDCLLINLAHALYENKAFSLHDILKIRHAIKTGIDWHSVADVARERGWAGGLELGLAVAAELEQRLFATPVIPNWEDRRIFAPTGQTRTVDTQVDRARAGQPRLPFPMSFVLTKRLFFEKIVYDRRVSPTEKPILALLALVRGLKGQLGIHPQNSALFTLSGPDGSGKTGQAEALQAVLSISELRSRILWARVGATPMMARLSQAWRGRRERMPEHGSATTVPERRPIKTGRLLVPWAMLSCLDFAAWLARIRWHLCRGHIVIADRYLCDLDVELEERLPDRPTLRRELMRALRTVAPSPTRAFSLSVEPDVARRRARADRDDADPGLQVDLYRERSETYGLVPVDANEPFDEAAAAIEREALQAYMSAFAPRLNLLFFSNPWQLNRRRGPRPRLPATLQPSR